MPDLPLAHRVVLPDDGEIERPRIDPLQDPHDAGTNNYTGVAKRNRVQERLREHMPGGKNPVPGAKVQIERMPSIDDARAKEARAIKRSQPPYNLRGK